MPVDISAPSGLAYRTMIIINTLQENTRYENTIKDRCRALRYGLKRRYPQCTSENLIKSTYETELSMQHGSGIEGIIHRNNPYIVVYHATLQMRYMGQLGQNDNMFKKHVIVHTMHALYTLATKKAPTRTTSHSERLKYACFAWGRTASTVIRPMIRHSTEGPKDIPQDMLQLYEFWRHCDRKPNHHEWVDYIENMIAQ